MTYLVDGIKLVDGQISLEDLNKVLLAYNVDLNFTTEVTPEDYMNNTGIADFLNENNVNTSFIDDLPSFNVSLVDVLNTYIDNQNDISVLSATV